MADYPRENIEQRLAQLRGEYEAGRKMLAEFEERQRALGETLLRIAGAIQVLEEVLAPPAPAAPAERGTEEA